MLWEKETVVLHASCFSSVLLLKARVGLGPETRYCLMGACSGEQKIFKKNSSWVRLLRLGGQRRGFYGASRQDEDMRIAAGLSLADSEEGEGMV
ncbi:MAG: hypothetical protein ACKO6N_29000 [Myxococcota bacterium]